jgi:predicted AlkP superfamily pyrophosphatase or phosphodiesterase
MLKIKFFAAGLMACLLLAVQGCTTHPAPAAAPQASNADRIVVMISVDGLAAFYLDDPKADVPTMRELAAQGARATMMKASTPTVTWPNHTTLVTGDNPARHGVVGNNYFDRQTGKKVTLIADPVYDKDQIVKVPTIYDVAKADGMKTAGICWPATRNAKTLDWTTPDVGTKELRQKYTTPGLFEEWKRAGIDLLAKSPPHSKTNNSDSKDDLYTAAFDEILHNHRPNLALLHIAYVDHTQHLYGPRTPEAYAAIKAADQQVGAVWEELQRDFPNRATLLVVSDHGFSPTERTILPNVILRKAGVRGVDVIVQGGAAMLYIADEANRAAVMEQARTAFAGVPGVSKVAGPDELKAYGVADPMVDPHAPDMIVFAEEGCSFGDTAAGSLPFSMKPERRGGHGHDANLPDLHATFIIWGAGIKPGVKLGEISNIDVAPTIAKLLGIELPNVDGKPLSAVLAE